MERSQELAGCVVRGTTEERTKLIFQVVPKDSANKVTLVSATFVVTNAQAIPRLGNPESGRLPKTD